MEKLLNRWIRRCRPELVLLVALFLYLNRKALTKVKAALPSWSVQSL